MSQEIDRARILKQTLLARGIEPESFIEQDYPAVGLHSNSTIFSCNQGLVELTGYSIDELEGMNAWKLFASESSPVLMDNLRQLSEQPYQAVMLAKDGSKQDIELKGKNFELDGELVRAVLVKVV